MEIDDDNSCNGTKTKKKPLDLGWNRLLPTTSSGDDDGRSPELIITTSTNKFDGGGGEVHAPPQEDQKDDLDIMTKTDDEINECIARKKKSFQVLGKRLPDKGEKIMEDIRRHEIELERRNMLKLEKETCEAEVKQETFEAEDGNPVQKKKRGRSPILQAKQPNGLQKDRQRMVDTPPTEPLSPDIEVVRETQEHGGDNGDGSSQQKKKRVHRKKGADEPRLKTKPIAWTNDEQMSLAKAWLQVTEDPMCRNSCSRSPDQHDDPSGALNNAIMNTEYQQVWPFIKQSAIWATIKSLELYRQPPQKPHFSPLKKVKVDYCEGLAFSHMVTFDNLFHKISKIQLTDPVDIIKDSLEILVNLETHGFDVGSVRALSNELLSSKDKVGHSGIWRKRMRSIVSRRY